MLVLLQKTFLHLLSISVAARRYDALKAEHELHQPFWNERTDQSFVVANLAAQAEKYLQLNDLQAMPQGGAVTSPAVIVPGVTKAPLQPCR